MGSRLLATLPWVTLSAAILAACSSSPQTPTQVVGALKAAGTLLPSAPESGATLARWPNRVISVAGRPIGLPRRCSRVSLWLYARATDAARFPTTSVEALSDLPCAAVSFDGHRGACIRIGTWPGDSWVAAVEVRPWKGTVCCAARGPQRRRPAAGRSTPHGRDWWCGSALRRPETDVASRPRGDLLPPIWARQT